MRSPGSLRFSKLNKSSSLNLSSQERCSSPLIISVALSGPVPRSLHNISWGIEHSPSKKDGRTGRWQVGHEPAMCVHSTESQPYPGLHQKKHGQQVEGSYLAPLLCAGETQLGVLHPDVESSGQERCGSVGVHPEKGHKNDPRDGITPLQGQAERDGAVQP